MSGVAPSGHKPDRTRARTPPTVKATDTPLQSPVVSLAPGGDDAPTESHALAAKDHEEKGTVQDPASVIDGLSHGVRDLGWNEEPERVSDPLVGGVSNDELWTLIRRFNKQIYRVKALEHLPLGGLDLNIASEDEFSPDKLRSNIERLYMTVMVGLVAFVKHMARIRSWRETKRTTAFCAAYFTAWALDLLVPLITSTLIVLIVHPPSRGRLFPPAPLAMVDAQTGGIKKPAAGSLGSHNSLTGAPEKHHGEAVEQEAHHVVSSFGAIVVSSVVGKRSQNSTVEESSITENLAPDPTEVMLKASEARSATPGDKVEHDRAKKPVEEAMWSKMRPIMHTIGDIADIWERFGNMLSPTSPFPKTRPRLTLAGFLLPILLLSLLVNPYMVAKGSMFGFGIVFFGDPVIQRILPWATTNLGGLLDIQNTLLKGAPTNAQLALTLLRVGEARRTPLPPPPSALTSPRKPELVKPLSEEDIENLPTNDPAEVATVVNPDTPGSDKGDDTRKKRPGRMLISFFKGTTKTGVNATLSTDPVKASMGSEKAQNRLGAVPNKPPSASGPTTFPCRHHGKQGALQVLSEGRAKFIFDRRNEALFDISVGDIRELRKAGGLGWKGKLVVGWSLNRDVLDGVEIVMGDGRKWLLTAMQMRDEGFNRLVSMGAQKWEAW